MDEEEMQENNDNMQALENKAKEKIADAKEDVQDAKDAAKIGAKAATGNEVGAAKDAVQMAARKFADPKKMLKKVVLKAVRPIIIFAISIIIIATIFYGAATEASRLIKEALDDYKDTIASWVTPEGIKVDDKELDAFIYMLEKKYGISLADMGFGADYTDVKDDDEYKKASPSERTRIMARKYIKKFIEASLVTQTVNTHNIAKGAIAGGIEIERHDAETNRKSSLSYTDSLGSGDYSHFTINSDGKVVFNSKSSGQTTIDTSAYEQYSIPIMYFIDLCLTTQNPKYVEAIADEIIEGNLSYGGGSGGGSSSTETGNLDVDGYTQKIIFNGVEYKEYKQNSAKWASSSYWGGTIEGNGCGPTSIAVILSGFASHKDVTPVEVANGMSYTGSGTIKSRLSDYGISSTIVFSPTEAEVRAALSSGCPAIFGFGAEILSDGTRFTSNVRSGHISAGLSINGDEVYVSNVYHSSNLRTGWVPVSDVVRATSDGYMIQINSTPDNIVETTTAKSLDGFLFLGDSRINALSDSRLKNALGNNVTIIGVDSSRIDEWENVTSGASNYIRGTAINFPSNVSGINIMLGANGTDDTNMKKVLNDLHTKYPNVTIYVNSVYHLGANRSSATNINLQYDNFNSQMQSFCAQNDWAVYVDITGGLHDSSGLLKSEYDRGDGIHMNYEGNSELVNNIKNGIASGGNSSGITSLDGFLFIGDSRFVTQKSELEKLGNNVNVVAVGATMPSYWLDVTDPSSPGKGYIENTEGYNYVELPETANGVCILIGGNPEQTSEMKQLMENVHKRYNAPVFVCSILHAARGWSNIYYTAESLNKAYDDFGDTMKNICSTLDWASYIDIQDGLLDSEGYLKSEYASDGVHIYTWESPEGTRIFNSNIKNAILSSKGTYGGTGTPIRSGNGSWMTISILDSCTVTSKTTWTHYEETGDEGIEVTEYTTGPDVTTEHTTSYYLTQVNHLLFGLSKEYRTTRSQSTSEYDFSGANYYGTVTTEVNIYGFTQPVEQDPVIKCEENDFFVKTSKKKFKIPGVGGKARAYDSFLDGGEIMFILMDRDVENELLCQLTKYVLYKMTGHNFGVKEIDGTTLRITGFSTITGLYGDSIEEKVWWALRDAGYSKEATAGVMGNISHESGFKTNNLENSYESSLGSDEAYTEAVNNGSYTGDQFTYDSAGYGLVQWTYYTLKRGLYNFAKSRGVSIDDPSMQIEYLLGELNPSGGADGYATYVLTARKGYSVSDWKDATDPETAAMAFCWIFENPAYGSYTRATSAREYYERFKDAQKPESEAGTPETTTDTRTGPNGYVHPCSASSISSYPGGHQGYDFAANKGTPVYAVTDGIASFYQIYATSTNKLASYGNVIYLNANDGHRIVYAHLDGFNGVTPRLPSSASMGYPSSASQYDTGTYSLGSRSVRKGELIGYVGTTGNSTGPHLHFEIQGIGNSAWAYKQYIPSPN